MTAARVKICEKEQVQIIITSLGS